MVITSQLPAENWHDVIGEPTFADAILDRLVHNAHRLPLDGPSMRKPNNMTRARTTAARDAVRTSWHALGSCPIAWCNSWLAGCFRRAELISLSELQAG